MVNAAEISEEDARRLADRKSAIYRTVAIFSDLTKRTLWVRDGGDDLAAHTDGREIIVPFKNEDAYLLTEHELAHILFRSNVKAKQFFVSSFADRIFKTAASSGVILSKEQEGTLVFLLDGIVQLLEDYRVESLWGVLYPGSFRLRLEMSRKLVQSHFERWKGVKNLLQAMGYTMVGMPVPDGKFQRFEPIFIEGFKMVRRRGVPATFLAARFIISALIDELLDASSKKHAPDQKAVAKQLVFLVSPEDLPAAKWGYVAPTPNRDPKDRSTALEELLTSYADPRFNEFAVSDLQESKFQSRWETEQAKEVVERSFRILLQDRNSMLDYLKKTERQMQDIIDAARQALFRVLPPEEALQRNAMARVVIHRADAVDTATSLTREEREVVRKLQSVFFRTLGRIRSLLDTSGMEIDTETCIANKISGRCDPCFVREELGRGFRGLLLIDRSGSMGGWGKKTQSESACRILGAALTLPFVRFDVWGFQQLNDGQVDITKFGRSVRSLDGRGGGEIGGQTPLHAAVRLGVRQLMNEGHDAKHLFVITDGFPVYSTRTGHVSTKALMRFVREEVLFGRHNGVSTIGVLIGESGEVSDNAMQFMFGRREFWRYISPSSVQTDLVQLVASSFVRYLRNR